MATNIITQDDLEEFKKEFFVRFKNDFLDEMKLVITTSVVPQISPSKPKKIHWIKSHQVMRMLNISTGKLQTLRNTGLLPFSNLEGIIYYMYDDVDKMLLDHRTDHSTFK
jgi:hypothetical protein